MLFLKFVSMYLGLDRLYKINNCPLLQGDVRCSINQFASILRFTYMSLTHPPESYSHKYISHLIL